MGGSSSTDGFWVMAVLPTAVSFRAAAATLSDAAAPLREPQVSHAEAFALVLRVGLSPSQR
jgi:hypothetical protein